MARVCHRTPLEPSDSRRALKNLFTKWSLTVSSKDYALENGLSVGSKAQDVRAKLGEPNETQIKLEPKQIKLDALVYSEYTFLLDESDRVTAIRVGR